MFNISTLSAKKQKQKQKETNLVSKTVQRTSKTAHTSTEWKVRIRQGASNQVSGVGTDVTTFVVAVDDQVQTHQFSKVNITVAQHFSQIGTKIFLGINWCNFTVLVQVSVDASGNNWQFSNEINWIFISVLEKYFKQFHLWQLFITTLQFISLLYFLVSIICS